jgi:hypothetical protein
MLSVRGFPFTQSLFTGRTCPSRSLHRRRNAFAQGHLRSSWPCLGICNSHPPPALSLADGLFLQTSLLPENDRTSVTLKEYLAGIDVSMGGRVAEELSKQTLFRLLISLAI